MKRLRRYFERRSKRLKFRRFLSASMGCDVVYRGEHYYVGSSHLEMGIDLISTGNHESTTINGSKLNDVTVYVTREHAREYAHIILFPFKYPQIDHLENLTK